MSRNDILYLEEMFNVTPHFLGFRNVYSHMDRVSLETANSIRVAEVTAASFLLGYARGKTTLGDNLEGKPVPRIPVYGRENARHIGAAHLVARLGLGSMLNGLMAEALKPDVSAIMGVLENEARRLSTATLEQLTRTLDSIEIRLANLDINPLDRKRKLEEELEKSGVTEYYRDAIMNLQVFAYNLGIIKATWNSDKIAGYKFACHEQKAHPICEVRHNTMLDKDPELVRSNLPPLHELCRTLLEPLKINEVIPARWTMVYNTSYKAYPLFNDDPSLSEIINLAMKEGGERENK